MTTVLGLAGYHSTFNEYPVKETACGCALLPLREPKVGTIAELTDRSADIVDEALNTFKANTMLQVYAVLGPADRVLMWITMFIHQVLVRVRGKDRDGAQKAIFALLREQFAAPGDSAFVLGGFFPKPGSADEKAVWTAYFKTIREVVCERLIEKVRPHPTPSPPLDALSPPHFLIAPQLYAFPEPDGTLNKYWAQFALHPFMGRAFDPVPVGASKATGR